MKTYTEIWEDIILWEIVWRLEIIEEEQWFSLSFYDKNNKFIADIWYEESCLWESYRDDFIKYLDSKN